MFINVWLLLWLPLCPPFFFFWESYVAQANFKHSYVIEAGLKLASTSWAGIKDVPHQPQFMWLLGSNPRLYACWTNSATSLALMTILYLPTHRGLPASADPHLASLRFLISETMCIVYCSEHLTAWLRKWPHAVQIKLHPTKSAGLLYSLYSVCFLRFWSF